MKEGKPEPKKPGRPRSVDGPKLPKKAAVKLLVEGERVSGPDGLPRLQWPSQREVARRFDVAPSVVAELARREKTAQRRAEFVSQTSLAGAPGKAPPAPAPRPTAETLSTPTVDAFAKKVTEAASRLQPRLPGAGAGPSPCAPGTGRPPGRPRKGDEPWLPYEEIDRALVFGELVSLPQGGSTLYFPRHRELASRYGVACSVISSYAKSHNCLRRRASAQSKIAQESEKQMVKLRANAIALGKTEVIKIIDSCIVAFDKALDEGRVRTDNPSDLNTLVRLKEFVQGGADSRPELHASISLQALQEAHAQALRTRRQCTPALTGAIESRGVTVREHELPGDGDESPRRTK